jgi:hypothetical protein
LFSVILGTMDLGKIGERIQKKLKRFADEKAGPLADRLLSRVPEEKRTPLLLCRGGIVVLLISLTVITLASGGHGAREVREAAELVIPPEELFFPGEPDFVPSLLLEREPRRFWTPDDIAPFWEDPGSLSRDQWVKEMGLVIDELMENVP